MSSFIERRIQKGNDNGMAGLKRDSGLERHGVKLDDATKYLREVIGPQVVAYAVGLNDTATVHGWADGSEKPFGLQKEKLALLYDATRALVNHEGTAAARAMIIGKNPHLDDNAIATVIREARVVGDARIRIMGAIRNHIGGDMDAY